MVVIERAFSPPSAVVTESIAIVDLPELAGVQPDSKLPGSPLLTLLDFAGH